jgi:hypothetical protein
LVRAGAPRRLEVFVFPDVPAAFDFSSVLDGGSAGVCIAGGSLAGKVFFKELATAAVDRGLGRAA